MLLGIVAIGLLGNVLYLRRAVPQAKGTSISGTPSSPSVATSSARGASAATKEGLREDWPPEEQKLAIQKQVHEILQERGGKWAHGIETRFYRLPASAEYNGPSCVIEGKRVPPDGEENLPWRLIFFQDVETKVWHRMYFYVDGKKVPEFRPGFSPYWKRPTRLMAPSGSKNER